MKAYPDEWPSDRQAWRSAGVGVGPDVSAVSRLCRRLRRLLRHLVLLGFLVAGGYPLLWMFLAALRPEADLLLHPFAWYGRVTLANFRVVLEAGAFGRAYLNSVLVCSLGVAGTVALAAPAAFAFARFRFHGRETLFLLFLAGMMIPVHVTLIPLNRLLGAGGLDLKGTCWVLIGPYIGFSLPVSILILRGAFRQIGEDLFEAARLDGCSNWGLFRHVALPLVRPAMATVVVFSFLTMWNEFAFALTLINDSRARTLPLALWQFRGERGMFLAQTCAALAVTVLPVLVLYCLAQRQIIRGLTAGTVGK